MAMNTLQPKAPTSHPMMGTYFSPPEGPRVDSFSSMGASPEKAQSSTASGYHGRLPSIKTMLPPLSPPISPHTQLDKEPSDNTASQISSRDPPLFPSIGQNENAQPLFQSTEHEDIKLSHDQHIDSHIRERHAQGQHTSPKREDYELFASFVATTVEKFNKDRVAYMNRELEYLQAYPARFPQNKVAGIKRAAPQTKTPSTVKKAKVVRSTSLPKLPTIKRKPRASPREAPLGSFEVENPAAHHERKVSRTTPHRDDSDYSALPDYSPPVSTIPNTGKAMKVDWRGGALDASLDPDKDKLHPAELDLACTLRLTCAQYLCSKRRIFVARLESYRNGKEFRKTTAQQACKIDVNKASKLWTAFDKVGWFNPKYMVQYA